MPRNQPPNDHGTAPKVTAPIVPASRGIAAVVHRVERIEQWLVAGMSPRRAASEAQKPPPEGLGLKRHASNRYVAVALGRLMANQSMEPIESKRARLSSMVQEGIYRSVHRRRYYVDKHGVEKSYPEGDERAAAAYLDILVRLELRT